VWERSRVQEGCPEKGSETEAGRGGEEVAGEKEREKEERETHRIEIIGLTGGKKRDSTVSQR
jgi:hypothetical protein